MALQDLLDIPQAAAYLRLSEYTVRKLAREGRIPAFKVGKEWRFNVDALKAWESSFAGARPDTGGTILIIDDEEAIRTMVQVALHGSGFQTILAPDANFALALLAGPPPDLVLLDLVLPGMNGPELLSKLRAVWAKVPVVIMTGFPDSDLMTQALEHSPITLLAKPFSFAQLLECVRQQCRRT